MNEKEAKGSTGKSVGNAVTSYNDGAGDEHHEHSGDLMYDAKYGTTQRGT
jgi:hypothetical protein